MLDASPDHLVAVGLTMMGFAVFGTGCLVRDVRRRWLRAFGLIDAPSCRCQVRPGAICDWCRPGAAGSGR